MATLENKIIKFLEKEQRINKKALKMYVENKNDKLAYDTNLIIRYTDLIIKEIMLIEHELK